MRNPATILSAMMVAILFAGCRAEPWTGVPALSMNLEVTETLPATIGDLGIESLAPVCLPPDGDGTVVPAISIYSIAFVVNGLEHAVFEGDALQVSPGDEVEVREVIICTPPFSGSGGEACVDLVPVDQNAREITTEHAGTHMVKVTPGFLTVPGPDRLWIASDIWREISAVLNHWPATKTEDLGCADGDCERDDRMSVPIH